MKAPFRVENIADVSTIDSTRGDLFTARCTGFLTPVGTFTAGALEISVLAGEATTFLPLTRGAAYPIHEGDIYRVLQSGSATGTLELIMWPTERGLDAAIAQLAVAASGEGSLDDDILAVLEDIQDAQGASGTNRTSNESASSANSALTVDLAAGGGTTVNVVKWVHVTFRGAIIPTSSKVIEVLDGAGGTVLWSDVIGVGESEGTPHQTPPGFAVECTANTLARLSIPALGANVVAEASIGGILVP